MRIVAVSMVRNEADIIESFVRHQCGILDHLVVVDHGSTDRTPDILAALVAEGVPLTVASTRALGNVQARVLTQAMRDAARRHAADFAFALDADEFLHGDRASLEAALARVPAGGVGALRWLTFVPIDASAGAPLERLRLRVPRDADRHVKVVLDGALAARDGWVLAPGNHAAFAVAEGRLLPLPTVPLDDLRIAHLPLRSVEQMVLKVVQGWLGTRLQEGRAASARIINAHWRTLFEHYLAGGSFVAGDLRRLAVTTYVDPARTEEVLAGLVEDPLPAPLLRHTTGTPPDAAREIAHWAHRLVEQVVASAPEPAPAPVQDQIRSSA